MSAAPLRLVSEPLVERPPLDRFGVREAARVLVIGLVLGGSLLAGLGRHSARRLLRGSDSSWQEAAAEATVDAFERLGPLFVKLGQLIASSSGAFPPALSAACLRCLDRVRPFPAAEARRIVGADLGHPVDELFRSFDDAPLSAASVAQVHACVLPDGREAVLKVQRPGIAGRMIVDLRAALRTARLLQRFSHAARVANAVGVVHDLYEATVSELNFLVEAENQRRIRADLGAFGDNGGVMVPEVYSEHCGPRVLCMERVRGVPLDRFDVTAAHPDPELLIRRLVKVWLEGVTVHGIFHGDVHAGNLWLLDDGRLALLDFGIVGRMTAPWRQLVRNMFHASAFDGDFTPVATSLRELDLFPDQSSDDAAIGSQLAMVLGPILSGELAELDLKTVTGLMLDFGTDSGMSGPQQLILMGKQLGYFERYAVTLAPDWRLGTDLFLLRNVFPDEVAAALAERGATLPA
ncbi:ABC1 kinase family protein [Nocardia asteroides]|uniref:ABC1 kinase family protein n=1 Tax=Nocardia asteroides TaxID=1824 RepID=UPI001E3C1524|nr:AarF/ABC1/UbiB kinase family protein [Nocardia asteroides]UGT62332.1 AarF/ABC1/UbiB kinase family protein [Nocardia asteroides]